MTANNQNILDPFLPKEEYMIPAWIGCLQWAIGEEEIVKRFRADTGNQYQPPRNGLEQMIDEATGHGADFVKSFVAWFNENIWGGEPDDAP